MHNYNRNKETRCTQYMHIVTIHDNNVLINNYKSITCSLAISVL